MTADSVPLLRCDALAEAAEQGPVQILVPAQAGVEVGSLRVARVLLEEGGGEAAQLLVDGLRCRLAVASACSQSLRRDWKMCAKK